jgi:crotonobetainyl-CoA:carnitine CoA-transferase CaiB-like acyl-CoA transferase
MPGLLDGYRVLDLSIAMAGPLAAMRLGDLGADVIKVEPIAGEWQRHIAAGGARSGRINASFLSMNRNKRSLAIDLKDPRGRDVALRLAAGCDVVLQNYRPGVADRLGLGYDAVRAMRPDVVYVSISGYGDSGPDVDLPGQDLLLQGRSGAMFSTGRASDPPAPAPMFVVDSVTANAAVEATLAGLLHRARTGAGQRISISMLDVIVTLQMQEIGVYTIGGIPQRRSEEPHAHCYVRAPYGAFATATDYIVLAFPPLASLGQVLDIPELLGMDDEVDGHLQRDSITRLVAARLRDRPATEWLKLLTAAGLWAGPVNAYKDLLDDPQIRENGTFVTYEHDTEGSLTVPGFPARYSLTPAAINRGAPLIGQHSAEVLAALGLSQLVIDDLFDSGVVASELS